MNSRQCYPDNIHWRTDGDIIDNNLKGNYVNYLIYFNSSFFHNILKLFSKHIMEILLLSTCVTKIDNSSGSLHLYFIQRDHTNFK